MTLGFLQIDRQATFVAMQVLFIGSASCTSESAHSTHRWLLDLYDVRTPIAKQAHSNGPRPSVGEIQNPNV